MTTPIVLLAPAAGMTFAGMPSGSTYVSNQYGLVFITNNSVADEAALIAVGCALIYPSNGTIAFPVYAIAALPSPSAAGQRAFVSNASQTMSSSNIGAILSNTTGSDFVSVYSDGTNWRIG